MASTPPKKGRGNSTVARLKMLSPIPKKVKCRICKASFENPIRLGSGISIVTCDTCRKDLKAAAKLMEESA